MIDYIEGRIEYIESDSVTIGTNQGVGYRLFCPNPYEHKVKQEKRIFTHHYVREDAAHLYGFSTREQRDLFRKLLDVSGIGPKGALAIIASAAPAQIASAVQREDVNFLTKFPGIGKKTAGRMVLDLKDKLKEFAANASFEELAGGMTEVDLFSAGVELGAEAHEEAAEALKALGYSESEVQKVMSKLKKEIMTTEELIKKALQLFISK
ncbi:Holliday junction branch migration protein RuvA [Ammoniphilus sp. CFH 90114]|uniref:Holliday junction branch migration protein RuvA n=1 Tax=Ammoniphilus sp. CFH 90114 TaxID=2493665 RepID=UPI00100F0102|nr:Holliday junction branch migration protein RuvA [Ammoniphilus sp. CFH 90114]RXT14744.1 Holliday junction branch migration protein RuvA [Ammoniphilus sp. CFH 90114]